MTRLRKRSGELEEFDSAKLEASLARAGASQEHAHAVSEIVAHNLREGMESMEIRRLAAAELSGRDNAAAQRYEQWPRH
jgi:hypothetical protein